MAEKKDDNVGREFKCNEGAKFVVVETLKRGAWGQTYLAKSNLGHHVVVKQLLESARLEHSAIARFKQEVQFMASLPDPNIVTLITAELDVPSPWYVMEYAKDGSLQGWLQSNLPPARTPETTLWLLHVFTQVARALHAAHERKVIHRDVKPANVLLWCRSAVAKLSDFGLAMEMEHDAENLARTMDAAAGTISYMSPEQQDRLKLTPATDVYSLGVAFYECMTARKPRYRAKTIDTVDCIAALGDEARSKLAHLHANMMEEAPDARPPADAVATALMECQHAYWRITKAATRSLQQSERAVSTPKSQWRFELEPDVGLGAPTWDQTKDKRPNIWRGIGFTKMPDGSMSRVMDDAENRILYGPYKFDPPLTPGRYLVGVKGAFSARPSSVMPVLFEVTCSQNDKLGDGPPLESLPSLNARSDSEGFLCKLEFTYANQPNIEFRIGAHSAPTNVILTVKELVLIRLST